MWDFSGKKKEVQACQTSLCLQERVSLQTGQNTLGKVAIVCRLSVVPQKSPILSVLVAF